MASKEKSPAQKAVEELANKGVIHKDPGTGKETPIQHVPEGKKRGPAPKVLTPEEKAAKEQARKEAAKAKALLHRKFLADHGLIKPRGPKKDPKPSLLTRMKVGQELKAEYARRGGDDWLLKELGIVLGQAEFN